MSRLNHKQLPATISLLFAMVCGVTSVFGQSSSFTYQGRLTDGGTAANGNYDLQFALWDSLSGGSQIGSTQGLNAVAVSNGVFTVALDFGANSFSGTNRFLEINARPSGAGSFILLTPRQQLSSTPYAVRSVSAASADTATTATTATNATQLGGQVASQYVQANDSRLSDARPPSAGSGNYIQNSTSQQTSTNFNISGNGTVAGTLFANQVVGSTVSGTVVSAAQFNLGGTHVLTTNGTNSSSSLFLGVGVGQNQTVLGGNTFAGQNAGITNVNGTSDTFLGNDSGHGNSSGSDNVFLGSSAGLANTTGSKNTIIGSGANLAANNLTNATAIGYFASVSQSNSLVLGSNSIATNVGIGTTAPQSRLHVAGDVRVDGNLILFSLGTATATQAALCRNTSSQVAFCNSSSLRYKANVSTFLGGLEIVNRLRPISFTWKQDGSKDIGFGAEEVERVEPLFTFRNDKGQIEGVRYDRLGVVFVNAFKEQQAQIQAQQTRNQEQQRQINLQRAQIGQQQKELDALKKLVCRSHSRAAVCK
jgi:Chaperone of endosialidase